MLPELLEELPGIIGGDDGGGRCWDNDDGCSGMVVWGRREGREKREKQNAEKDLMNTSVRHWAKAQITGTDGTFSMWLWDISTFLCNWFCGVQNALHVHVYQCEVLPWLCVTIVTLHCIVKCY